MTKLVISIAGSSGTGIESSSEVLMRFLASRGYWLCANREYPSVIKGGCAHVSIQIGEEEMYTQTQTTRIGIGLGKVGLERCMEMVMSGGTIIHTFERWERGMPTLQTRAEENAITLIYVPCRELLKSLGASYFFENSIVLGAVARLCGIPREEVCAAFRMQYGKKESVRQSNLACLEAGYALDIDALYTFPVLPMNKQRVLLDGNTALALGAIQAGVRAFYAYPMSPSSSILDVLADTAMRTGMVVKQVEDEITAVQMTIGSMYAGTRALTATSGGGFDLMTESVSLSGMIEVPLVIVLAQRPGPATGLPTRTAQGDLRLAIHGGHGEFARIVVAVSDQHSAYTLIQHAFNYAETFQLPVIVLTDKEIADQKKTVSGLNDDILIERGLVTDTLLLQGLTPSDRYAHTESGVSLRRIPGSSPAYYFSNGDEHSEDGTLDESPAVGAMIAKRIKKRTSILASLPDPVRYGSETPDHIFVGRGSTKMSMLECLQRAVQNGRKIAYVHIERLRPLKTEFLKTIFANGTPFTVIENNATGQLATLLQQELAMPIHNRLCKRNGRQWNVDEVIAYIQTLV